MRSFRGKPGTEASALIRNKLMDSGGRATVYSYRGKPYEIFLSEDGTGFRCNALKPLYFYEFRVFDVVVDLLKREGGQAAKGQARGCEVGSARCDAHTVAGAVALHYFGKTAGETVLDPQSVLNAVLAWADIAENDRGSIRLTERYKKLIQYHK